MTAIAIVPTDERVCVLRLFFGLRIACHIVYTVDPRDWRVDTSRQQVEQAAPVKSKAQVLGARHQRRYGGEPEQCHRRRSRLCASVWRAA